LGGPGRGGPGGDLGQPGGGFGGGQGDTNPPPVGANVDGYLKAKIEPFFSGAFDPEKKEFFAFSSSANRNVISTTLHRYNVAESFNKAGSFKVHHFVSRAVIDPAKGLLYAATITRPSVATLGGQTMDQTTGVGDVVVYDLDAIRSDKVKDGGDLKSVHTFGLGKKICGLELSPDGKSLFVVTTVGSGKTHKSFLNVYDTETRKPVNQPTALEAPAWTASRSSDGKFLLIMDMVEPGSKTATTSRLRVYDTAGKKIKEHSLQGIGNDLAATANGQYVAAVMSAGALKLVLANETNNTRDLELGFGWKAAAKPGYVEYSPDGKHLYVSGHPFLSGSYPKQQGQQTHPGGLDVYDVVDADSPTGLKKTASIRTASKEMVGGHFFVSPTGEYLVFQTGVVLETARIGGSNGESNAVGGGFPGGGAGGLPGVAGGGGTPASGVGEGVPMGGLPVAGGGMPPAAGAGRPPKPGVSAGGVGPPGGPPMGAGGGGARPPLKPITPNGGGGSGGGSPGKPGGSGT